jgi:hypothetical protein
MAEREVRVGSESGAGSAHFSVKDPHILLETVQKAATAAASWGASALLCITSNRWIPHMASLYSASSIRSLKTLHVGPSDSISVIRMV